MRKLTLLIALFVCSLLHANDIIILRNSTRIDAIITEVSDETVKYHKASNPDGPIFVTKTSEISSILYDNGEVQAFNAQVSLSDNQSQSSHSGKGAHFQGMVDIGAEFSTLRLINYYDYSVVKRFYAGPTIDFTFGYRIRDFVFVGGGLGFNTMLRDKYKTCSLLGIFHANVRFYIPASENTMPFFDIVLGADYGTSAESFDALGHTPDWLSFYTRLGFGVEYKKFNIGLGYELTDDHSGYLRLGARF